MADTIDENINENMGMDTGAMKDKAKSKISQNKRGLGIAATAALIGTGYMIGKKHAESRSPLHRIKSQLGL